jgi:hypothetical protein
MAYVKFEMDQPQLLKLASEKVQVTEGSWGPQWQILVVTAEGETMTWYARELAWQRLESMGATKGSIWQVCLITKNDKKMYDVKRATDYEQQGVDGEALYVETDYRTAPTEEAPEPMKIRGGGPECGKNVESFFSGPSTPKGLTTKEQTKIHLKACFIDAKAIWADIGLEDWSHDRKALYDTAYTLYRESLPHFLSTLSAQGNEAAPGPTPPQQDLEERPRLNINPPTNKEPAFVPDAADAFEATFDTPPQTPTPGDEDDQLPF